MRYSTENPYELITHAGLPYVATERFAVDQLLGRQVANIDRYMFYVPVEDFNRWQKYLSQSGAQSVDVLGNIFMIPSENFDALSGHGKMVSLEVLAADLKLKAPRYLTRRFNEIKEKVPELASIILRDSLPESLNLPDSVLTG